MLSCFEAIWMSQSGRLQMRIACQQTDFVSCGLFACMNTKETVQERDFKMRKSQVNQEKAALWHFCLFHVIAMKLKQRMVTAD
jgi:hypothetical protein